MVKALIMAGGSGTRLSMKGAEKPLLKVCDHPMIQGVVNAVTPLAEELYVAASKATARTAEWAITHGYRVIMTKGFNYPEDLEEAIRAIKSYPVLTAPADLPFLTTEVIKLFLEKAMKEDAHIVTLIVSKECFPKELKSDPTPVGISLIRGRGRTYTNVVMCSYPELLDIDTYRDLVEALRICKLRGGRE